MTRLNPKNVAIIVKKGKSTRLASLLYTTPHGDEHYHLKFSDETVISFPRSGISDDGCEMEIFYINKDSLGAKFDNQEPKKGPEGLKQRLLEIEKQHSPVHELLILPYSQRRDWDILFPQYNYPLSNLQLSFNSKFDEQAA
jgi:hypothetical protein